MTDDRVQKFSSPSVLAKGAIISFFCVLSSVLCILIRQRDMFFGSFDNKVDKKGRVSVPSNFRVALEKETFKGVVAFASFRLPCIEVCAYSYMNNLREKIGHYDLFSDSYSDLAVTILGNAHSLPFDPEGRIMIPALLLEEAKIDERAAFIGVGDLFQIWEPTALQAYRDKARQRVMDQKLTLPSKAAQS